MVSTATEIVRLNKSMVLTRRGKILSQPAIKSGIVGYFEKGAVLKVTGKIEKEGIVWYRIVRYGGRYGYLPSFALAEIKK
ncbi:MAG: SH3 domain-containing protein [Rhodospirillales bacterium]